MPDKNVTAETSAVWGNHVTVPDTPDGFTVRTTYPANPNGAELNVAGLCDETGRVFGLMPHPERFIDPTQHPRWTRELPARGTPARGTGDLPGGGRHARTGSRRDGVRASRLRRRDGVRDRR